MRRLVVLAAALILTLAGCGGGSDGGVDPLAGGTGTTMPGMGTGEHADHGGNPTSTCSPSGTTLTLTASGTKFNTDCLAAPASQPFTINFENKDSLPHNLQILESHSASEALFDAELIQGPAAKTLNVGALKPGTFAFHCKIHPGLMSGTFIVK
ncbi:MAG: cupredoxin domain-containing protein [Acidimicrobiales bacterium]